MTFCNTPVSCHLLTICSMYEYDTKNATRPSGTLAAMSMRIRP